MKSLFFALQSGSVLLSTILGVDMGYHLWMARDAREALELAEKAQPDLVLFDIDNPKIDGFNVCRSLKRSSIQVPPKVIVLTGLVRDVDKQKAIEYGADDFAVKPSNPTALTGLLYKIEQMLIDRTSDFPPHD